MTTARLEATPIAAVMVFMVVLLAQSGLIFNPGYLSHDELQWAAFAGTQGPLPWLSWTAVDVFQYRPLTFNLWLWLSRRLFAHPFAFHAVIVAWGAANAAMTCALARRFDIGARAAVCGALLFALGPYAMYVDGWVATIGDLAWVSCTLSIGLLVFCARSRVRAMLVAGLLTLLGLLAKEAAIAIPGLLAVAWWFDGRQRHWRDAAIASSAVAFAYLVVRVEPLLHAAREGANYTPALSNVPMRWLEYQLFALLPQKVEIGSTFAMGASGSVIGAAVLYGLLIAALARSSRRLALLFLVGGISALAPVLPLGGSANQYGYGFAALGAVVIAAAWASASRWGRAVFAMVALVSVWHGVNVMGQIRHAGDVQSVFSPALANALRGHDGGLRLRMSRPADRWIYQRLTHAVPGYDGVAIGNRVQLVDGNAGVDVLVRADGSLEQLH